MRGDAVDGVFRCLVAACQRRNHRHEALGIQVVDLVGLHLLDAPDQVVAVRQVAVVERKLLIQIVESLI